MSEHRFAVSLEWTGAGKVGTTSYTSYGREHRITAPGKPELLGSADPAFRGDAGRYNPEELLVASLSACHMLWFLHLAADAGVVVMNYVDRPEGVMTFDRNGDGKFSGVVLRPEVTVRGSNQTVLEPLHQAAHARCFIAKSVNFPVAVRPA